MSDFLDLQGAKDLNTDAIHIKAVANSVDPVTGAPIDEHVNRVGGTDYTLQGFWNALGPVVMPWTSVTGGTLTQPNQAFLHPANGNYYSWTGAYPAGGYVVAPGTDPTAVTGYEPRTDVVFRAEITPSVTEALRRSYAEAGFNLVPGSFEASGTVTTATDVLLYEAEGKAYAWGGTLPKTAPIGSTPSSSGGVGASAWIGVSATTLQSQLPISVLSEGAKPDSTTGLDGSDSTAAFLSAIAKCKSSGRSLVIPKGSGGYRLTQTVELRGVNLLDSDATLFINHAGIGVIFGGNANNANNPRQSFGSIIRVTGTASRTTPDMRGIGVKGQHIHVERCDYFQLYADNSAPNNATDYSCAYSTLNLKKVDTVELYGKEGTDGWINENTFNLNRTNRILFAAGQYQHNHNEFYRGTMEGVGVIDLQVGASNYFYGFRFERSAANSAETLTINFGAQTFNNVVESTWRSGSGYSNEPYNPRGNQVIVNDLGSGNAVFNAQDTYSDEVTLFSLSENTPFVSSANTQLSGMLTKNTDIHGVRFIQHLVDGRFKCRGNFGSLLMDDRKIPVRNGDMFLLNSDVALFRPVVFLYDSLGNLIQTEPSGPEAFAMPGKLWNADGYYSLSANTSRSQMLVGAGVSAIRIQINTGGSVDGQTFKFLRFTARFYKDSTVGSRKVFGLKDAIRKTAMSYFNTSDISMANIAEGLPCYKNDMTEMKINLLRQRYLVKSVSGNVITVAGFAVQYFDLASAQVAYTASDDNVMVPVSAVSGQTITLTNPVPAEIVAGSSIDFLITKTKTLP